MQCSKDHDLKGRLTGTEQQLAAAQAQVANLEENAKRSLLLRDKRCLAASVSGHGSAGADKLVANALDANAECIRNRPERLVRLSVGNTEADDAQAVP